MNGHEWDVMRNTILNCIGSLKDKRKYSKTFIPKTQRQFNSISEIMNKMCLLNFLVKPIPTRIFKFPREVDRYRYHSFRFYATKTGTVWTLFKNKQYCKQSLSSHYFTNV